MQKISVTENFIENSKTMAKDLLGLAQFGNDSELKKKLRYHIKQCEKYLCKLDEKE